MRGPRIRRGLSAVLLCPLLALSVVSLGGGGTAAPDADAEAAVGALLDRRAAALLRGDGDAYAATGVGAGLAEPRSVPLTAWSYRVRAVRLRGGTGTADVDLRYRLDGHDEGPVTVPRTVGLVRGADGAWRVAFERPAPGGPERLWDQGPVVAVRGARSLVLGVDRPTAELRLVAALADRAVSRVPDVWADDWARRVVVLVPSSSADMAALLGAPASAYRGVAAVTTGRSGVGEAAPADRIIVNPESYGLLTPEGRQVVMTHEATHVATRAHTTPATPLWLSEGYADWVGFRDTDRAPREVAPEVAQEVAGGRIPETLPSDADFALAPPVDAATWTGAYEESWTACDLIASRWGEERLAAFYRGVGAEDDEGAVSEAMVAVLGRTPERFVQEWRAALREEFG
ncbi:hypothetical protein [Streptomyces sp. WMMC905]|uniref:hypothetical protein n=1 Tax=Streptomyces sp. WMMC905 TaxID=3404123 RepID=UPI003B922B54